LITTARVAHDGRGGLPALREPGLRKSFGDNVVLDGIDLDICEGSVFSLLGPNGAGTIRVTRRQSTTCGLTGTEVVVGVCCDAGTPIWAIQGHVGVDGSECGQRRTTRAQALARSASA
jgi:ABC-2 type transport system ATP-binding protein